MSTGREKAGEANEKPVDCIQRQDAGSVRQLNAKPQQIKQQQKEKQQVELHGNELRKVEWSSAYDYEYECTRGPHQ